MAEMAFWDMRERCSYGGKDSEIERKRQHGACTSEARERSEKCTVASNS